MIKKFIPILILIFAMTSIQFGASLAKGLFPLAGIAGTSTLRLSFASFMLLLIFKPWQKKFSAREIKSLLLYGISLGLMNLAFYFALERIPLGIAVALEFTGPLAVAVFSSRRGVDFLWAILAALGIFLLVPTQVTGAALDFWGVIFALLAGLFWGLYIIYGKRAGGELSGGIAASMGMTIAALCVIPFGLYFDHARLFQLEALPIGLLVALFGSALPYTLEMFALKKTPAKTFGILMSMEPAIASFIGLILLEENLTDLQSVAIFCIIISSLGTSLSVQKS